MIIDLTTSSMERKVTEERKKESRRKTVSQFVMQCVAMDFSGDIEVGKWNWSWDFSDTEANGWSGVVSGDPLGYTFTEDMVVNVSAWEPENMNLSHEILGGPEYLI